MRSSSSCITWLLSTALWHVAIGVVKADVFDDAIRHAMKTESIPGVAVAFYDGSDPNNVVNFTRGYGHTSSDGSVNVTADTAFMLASVSKVFVGSVVALLLDQGLLTSLDEDICDSIPSTWSSRGVGACRHPMYPDVPVTWRMLVTHRSSLRDIPSIPIDTSTSNGNVNNRSMDDTLFLAHYGPTNFYSDWLNQSTYGNPTCPLDNAPDFFHALLTPDAVTTSVGGGDIDWYSATIAVTDGIGAWTNQTTPPGSVWGYSNVALGYIAALVEFKTNTSFASYCNSVLFDKLQMSNTAWFREDLPSATVQAVPQSYLEPGVTEDIGFYCFIDYTAGQLYSTANDLAKFSSSMLTRGVEDELWSDDVANMLFACQEQDESGATVPDDECRNGVSWFVLDNSFKEESKATQLLGVSTDSLGLAPFAQYDWTGGGFHAGSEHGVSTMIVILPAANVYVAVLTNIYFFDRFDNQSFGLITNAVGTAAVATTNSSWTPGLGISLPTAPTAGVAPSGAPSGGNNSESSSAAAELSMIARFTGMLLVSLVAFTGSPF